MDLDHGVAIVTGAAGGIGSVIARQLAQGGMSVVLADIDSGRLEGVRAQLAVEVPGAELVAVQGDVGDPEHHQDLLVAADALEGGLRLSVLNAGVSLPGLSWEVPLDVWETTTRVNYWGVVHGLRAALGEMVGRGVQASEVQASEVQASEVQGAGMHGGGPDACEGWVVAVSSGAGLVAAPGLAPYAATKHAVVGLMESTRHELTRVGSPVGVSVVCPGNVATDMPERFPVAGAEPGGGGPPVGSGPRSRFPDVVEGIVAAVHAGVAAGADPTTVADAIVDGVRTERFWLMPQPEIAPAAADRVRRIAERDDPVDLLG